MLHREIIDCSEIHTAPVWTVRTAFECHTWRYVHVRKIITDLWNARANPPPLPPTFLFN